MTYNASAAIMVLTGALALGLSGCSAEDPIIQQPLQTKKRAISFQPVIDKTQKGGGLQKVASLTTSNLTEFKVWAWSSHLGGFIDNLGVISGENFIWSASHFYPTNTPNRMVTRSANGAPWTYSPLAEWPDEGDVTFRAVRIGNNGQVFLWGERADTLLLNVDNNVDLLVAVATVPVPASNEPVQLTFHHAFSRVRVQVRNLHPTDTIFIPSVGLENIEHGGAIRLTADNFPPQGMTYDDDNPNPRWNTTFMGGQYHIEDMDFLYEEVNTLVPNDGNYVSVIGDSAGVNKSDNSFMLMPQATTLGTYEIGPGPLIDVFAFYLFIGGVWGAYHWIPVQHPGKDYGIVFEPGREYTFQVTLNYNREIHFDGVQVNDWDRTAGTGSDGNIGVLPEP